jgi:hypothetical protein
MIDADGNPVELDGAGPTPVLRAALSNLHRPDVDPDHREDLLVLRKATSALIERRRLAAGDEIDPADIPNPPNAPVAGDWCTTGADEMIVVSVNGGTKWVGYRLRSGGWSHVGGNLSEIGRLDPTDVPQAVRDSWAAFNV